jgi:formiminoglutamase
MLTRSKFCIIGIPDHQGVVHVGGRIGSAHGPSAFRRIFSRMKGQLPFQENLEDRGDVADISFDVAENHRRAADWIREAHSTSEVSLVIGGGHDHGYSHLLGVSEALQIKFKKPVRLGCMNIDAHLDVRKPSPWITSGSPFYLAVESGILDPRRFVEFGIQSHCNGPDLWNYVKNKKIKVIPWNVLRGGKAVSTFKKHLRSLATSCDSIVLSMDLDAAASAFAPGVSAPQAEGFTSSEMIEIAEIAGSHPKIISIGIFELNPEHDSDDRTARLAATVGYHFLESKGKR